MCLFYHKFFTFHATQCSTIKSFYKFSKLVHFRSTIVHFLIIGKPILQSYAIRMPPHQKRVIESKRFYIIISVLFAFLLCVPMWWYTTSVYRTQLPDDQIQNIQKYKVLFLSSKTHPIG